MNTNESAVFSIKDATNTEIYNAIDGSVWFKESDIERLAVAVESQDLIEVGRLYVAMLETNVLAERARSNFRAIEYSQVIHYGLTPRGHEILEPATFQKAGAL